MSAKGGTLLAKMGFRDADRADPMHDAAVAYVAANASRVYTAMTGLRAHSTVVKQEEVVSKGSGQYKTTIGFIDAVICAMVWQRHWTGGHQAGEALLEIGHSFGLLQEDRFSSLPSMHTSSVAQRSDVILGVEVKWTENSVSDAIRQIAVYKSFAPEGSGRWVWALATPRQLNIEQKAALDSNGFKYIRLNEANVREFATKQRATPASSEMVL